MAKKPQGIVSKHINKLNMMEEFSSEEGALKDTNSWCQMKASLVALQVEDVIGDHPHEEGLESLNLPSLTWSSNLHRSCAKSAQFAEVVKKVMNLGFDPSKVVFVIAVIVSYHVEQNMGTQNGGYGSSVYLRWDLVDVQKAAQMAAAVARVPNILVIVWRGGLCLDVQCKCFALKGLIKTGIHLSAVLMPSERPSWQSFVIKHQEQLPQLSVDGVLHNTARLHHHESIFRKVVQPNGEEEQKGSNRKANKTDLRSLECDIDPAHLSSTEKPDSGVSGNMAW
ncbi:hypothetical protein GH714_005871 [Hevea brasiliensis]|uniref:Uncharacterized protein n=1 Tax=Hevea brasiliensis TaxID=3981 RepID=A0A6A6N9Q6_HEVBR|nr:hypothetical protein GH714_005871 [Hevea brasiliensis]